MYLKIQSQLFCFFLLLKYNENKPQRTQANLPKKEFISHHGTLTPCLAKSVAQTWHSNCLLNMKYSVSFFFFFFGNDFLFCLAHYTQIKRQSVREAKELVQSSPTCLGWNQYSNAGLILCLFLPPLLLLLFF